MAKLYNKYTKLNKDVLLEEDDFLEDASEFLMSREGYSPDQLKSRESVYDAFMEHFRVQNVNEVTALRDLDYVKFRASDDQKAQLGRLMDTYDSMDSDFGFKAAQDYVGGVLSAPSTIAGLFSGGVTKLGAVAANQGTKLGIKGIINQSLKNKALLATVAADAAVAGGTVAAQEETRVDTGIKDEISMKNIGIATGLGVVASGTLTGLSAYKKGVRSLEADDLLEQTNKVLKEKTETAHKTATKKIYSNESTKKLAEQFEDLLITTKESKLPLKKTIPEELDLGKRLRKELKEEGKAYSLDAKEVQNISAAASKIYSTIGDKIKVDPTIAPLERFSSKLTRALMYSTETEGALPLNQLKNILEEHSITMEQLGPLYAAEISEAAAKLGAVGRMSQVINKVGGGKTTKYLQFKATLEALDEKTADIGSVTGEARRTIDEKISEDGVSSRIRKAAYTLSRSSVGLMTIQLATTIRNTTNGYLRNQFYAFDNLGAGLIYGAKGNLEKLKNPTSKMLKDEADESIRKSIAYLKTSKDSFLNKDLIFNITSAETLALFKALKDPALGQNEKISTLIREMGDLADITGQEKGLLGATRFLNKLNTYSDNMFKRAYFARELNKSLGSNPIKVGDVSVDSLDAAFKTGNLKSIPNQYYADAMEEAFDSAYQTGSFHAGRKGVFNTFARGFIELGQTPLGATFIPFPKYLVNQFRFVYEHTPVLGLMNFGGILNKPGKEYGKFAKLDPEQFAKSMTGLVGLTTFMSLRANYGDENTKWYEYKNPLNPAETFDARAALGPFSMYAFVADVLYRQNPFKWHSNDKVAQGVGQSINYEEAIKALGGGTIRSGSGLALIDGVFNIISGETGYAAGEAKLNVQETLAQYIGSTVSRPLIGAGMFKDVLVHVNPEYAQLPDNSDINPWQAMFKQAGRAIPFVGKVEEGGRDALGSPTRSGGRSKVFPILKQITGFTPMERRTAIENELSRLNLSFRDISPRRIKLDKPATNVARDIMGNLVEDELFALINTRKYRTLPDAEKYNMIKNDKEVGIGALKTRARKQVMDPSQYKTEAEEQLALRRVYLNLTKDKKNLIESRWKRSPRYNGKSIVESEAWSEGLALKEGVFSN